MPDNTGGFDERFFMYAEDIDLSKQIGDAGFANSYLGNLTILHFKGESTRKDAVYVKHFYRAMSLYIQKHYKGAGSRLSVAIMNAGIWARSLLARTGAKNEIHPKPEFISVQFLGDKKEIEAVKVAWRNH
jgi:GT2 family glycosyltransferase